MILAIGIWAMATALFCAVIGDFGWQNLIVGGAISSVLVWMFRKQVIPSPPPPMGLALHLLLYVPVLAYYLFIDILRGTYQVITTTLGIRPLEHPGIVRIPLETHSPYGVGPVGFFITLSPGSFLVDVDWENKIMLVHVLDASDPEGVRRDAEKYYRLWEYGEYKPTFQSRRPATRLEDEEEEADE